MVPHGIGYTPGLRSTPNKVKRTTDSSLIWSGVLSMGMEGIFYWGTRVTLLPHGEGGWVPTPQYAQISPQLKVNPLTSIKPCLYKLYCQYVILYKTMTQDQVIEM